MPTDPPDAGGSPDPLAHLTDIVSLSEAARVIGVTPNTVWRWAARGRLPTKRICAHCVIVRLSDVRAVDAAIRQRYPTVARSFLPGYGRAAARAN